MKTTDHKKKDGFEGQRSIVLPRKVISVQCSSNAIIGQAYITDIGYYPKAYFHYRQRPKGIDQNIIIYCVEGGGWAKISEKTYTVSAGEFIIIPAQTSHSYAADEKKPWTIYWLHIKGKLADAMLTAIHRMYSGHKGSINYNEKRIDLFNQIYSTLERGYANENIQFANMCLWYLMASFPYDAIFSFMINRENRDLTDVAIDFMQTNIQHFLTIKEIAQSVNLSVSHFAAIFQKRTGFSPIEYFNHLKIQRACQYLQFTDNRVKEIATNLGIEDPYYFSRLFKKIMGKSPDEYRRTRNH